MSSTSNSVSKSGKKPEAAVDASNSSSTPGGLQYVSTEFEVYGKVQGVFFRKYTQAKAKALGLHGWCRNTEKGTVTGVIQGLGTSINAMKTWLRSTGSPHSRIERADFTNEKRIREMDYTAFEIVR